MIRSLPLLLLGCALSLPLGAREFTSADGQQSIEATFVRYDKGRDQVTLRMPDGRNLVTTSEFFSDSDRKYFDEQAKAASIGSAIDVEVNENTERVTKSGSTMRIRYEKFNYAFEIKNRSDFDIADLEVKYWVVAERGNKPQIYKDTKKMSSIPANGSSELAGPEFSLIASARSTCDCPKVEEQARKLSGQKVIGVRIEIYGPDGQLLYEDCSSSKVDKAIGK